MKKNQFEDYAGKDKIVGRPKRVNTFELEVNEKGYAPLLFFSDLHLGAPNCALDKAKAMLNWALETKCSVLLIGDLLETGQKTSVGNSVYTQVLDPNEQIEACVDLFKPLAEANLIKGIHCGNHEQRISITAGIDVTKIIAKQLNVAYMWYAGWHYIKVGNQKYTVYATHGKTSAKYNHTKLNAAKQVSYYTDSDVIAYAHTHGLSTDISIKQSIDPRTGGRIYKKQYSVLCGSYLYWEKSYAEEIGLPPNLIGSPKAKFLADSHDVHFSL